MFEQRKEAPYSERLSKGVGLDDKMVYVYRTKCLRRISRDASVCWRGGMLLSKGIDLGNSLSRLAGGDSGMEQPHPMSCRDRIPPLQKYSNLRLNQFNLLSSINIPPRSGNCHTGSRKSRLGTVCFACYCRNDGCHYLYVGVYQLHNKYLCLYVLLLPILKFPSQLVSKRDFDPRWRRTYK